MPSMRRCGDVQTSQVRYGVAKYLLGQHDLCDFHGFHFFNYSRLVEYHSSIDVEISLDFL